MADVETCANPGCTEPGTKQCSACKTTPYCGPNCQKADWAHHKEECPGHLRKLGMVHLEKARAFSRGNNWQQSLICAELALTKLKQLKDRSLAFIEILDDALRFKFHAMNFMGQFKEALECATERYNMWATTNMRNHGMIEASFPLIESLMHNQEFAKAHLIASTVHDMTMHPMTHDIPENKQQPYLACAAHLLGEVTLALAEAGGIPPEEKQKAGEEAIVLARKAIEIHTQLHGADSVHVARAISVLARLLGYFNDVDDDEIIRLHGQSKIIFSRLEGSSSVNVAAINHCLGYTYVERANKVVAANDADRQLVNLKLALSHCREAHRIYRVINHMDSANDAAQTITQIEENIRQARIQIAARAAAAAATRG